MTKNLRKTNCQEKLWNNTCTHFWTSVMVWRI